MNASKEEARKADEGLEQAARLLDVAVSDVTQRNEIKKCLLRVQNFVEAAGKKLPTEASYAKEKERRVKKATRRL
jgi:hypothetical protein